MERKQAEQQLKALNETLEQRVAERTAVATRRAAQLQVLAVRADAHRAPRAPPPGADPSRPLAAASLRGPLEPGLAAASRRSEPLRQEMIARVDELLSQSLDVSRSLTVELSPPVLYEAGLAAALEWLGRHMQETCGLAVEVEADPEADPESEDLSHSAVRGGAGAVVQRDEARRTRARPSVTTGRPPRTARCNWSSPTRAAASTRPSSKRRTGHGRRLRPVQHPRAAGIAGRRLGGRRCARRRDPRDRSCPAAPCDVPADEGRTLAERNAGRCGRAGRRRPASAARPQDIRVLLADERTRCATSLARAVEPTAPTSRWWEWPTDGHMAVELAHQKRPDVVVVRRNHARLKRRGSDPSPECRHIPDMRIIGLSIHEEEDVALTMRAAGAAAYLTKGGSPSRHLIAAIRGHARPSHKDHYHDHRQQNRRTKRKNTASCWSMTIRWCAAAWPTSSPASPISKSAARRPT